MTFAVRRQRPWAAVPLENRCLGRKRLFAGRHFHGLNVASQRSREPPAGVVYHKLFDLPANPAVRRDTRLKPCCGILYRMGKIRGRRSWSVGERRDIQRFCRCPTEAGNR